MALSAARADAAASAATSAHRHAGRRLGLALASGLLLAAAYQPLALSGLAWVALVPLLLALDGAGLGGAAALGWCTGTAVGLGVCASWMWRAAIDYFGLGALAAAGFTVAAVQLFVAPYFALFAVLVVALRRRRRRWLLIPAAFVACELARATLGGNAWELLGHSQRALVLVQVASVTGAYGLSFLLALSATIVAELVRRSRPGPAPPPASAAALAGAGLIAVAAVLGFGEWRLRHAPATTGTLRVALVQGDVANADRTRAERAPEILARYLALTATVQPAATLTLWPENAIPVFPEDNPGLVAPLRALGTSLLAGAPRAGARGGTAAIYNAAYLFTASAGRPVYEKRRLLPFVERFALRPSDGPYLPGSQPAVVDVGPARLAVLICYEAIFPSLAAPALAGGANLLVNLSNDSWFDAGAGPAQHYELARFRAVESGVALLRATNSGISGAFDPHGRELLRLPRRRPVAAAVDVPLVERPSFYARHGDWFAALCVAAVAGGLAAALRPR